ncbi:MAG: hypothetical protein ACP5QT_00625 [Brevinematia bacterium]
MKKYEHFVFEVYETILDDSKAIIDRKKYLADNIFTLLEKALFPVKHSAVQKAVESLFEKLKEKKEVFSVFQQVEFIINILKINDIILFKKIYDCYVESSLQISPVPYHNISRALELLAENNKNIYLICNTIQTTGYILKFILKENNLYHFFKDFIFSEDLGIEFFNRATFEFFINKNELKKEEVVFITTMKNAHFEKSMGLNFELLKNESEIYNLLLSLI